MLNIAQQIASYLKFHLPTAISSRQIGETNRDNENLYLESGVLVCPDRLLH